MDNGHNCAHCHEIVRSPGQHTCGRTPQGTLPAHQPHKAGPVTGPAPSAFPVAMRSFSQIVAGIFGIRVKPTAQDDYTLAGPEES